MRRRLALAALALVAGAAMAQADTFAFMPDGGRGTFARAFPDPVAQSEALAQTRRAQNWQAALASSGLTDLAAIIAVARSNGARVAILRPPLPGTFRTALPGGWRA